MIGISTGSRKRRGFCPGFGARREQRLGLGCRASTLPPTSGKGGARLPVRLGQITGRNSADFVVYATLSAGIDYTSR